MRTSHKLCKLCKLCKRPLCPYNWPIWLAIFNHACNKISPLLYHNDICSSYHNDPYMLFYSGCIYAPYITMIHMIMFCYSGYIICSSYHNDPYMLCYSGCLYVPHITMIPMIILCYSGYIICSSYHNDPYMFCYSGCLYVPHITKIPMIILCYSGYIYAPHITMILICSAIQDAYMLLISQWSLW